MTHMKHPTKPKRKAAKKKEAPAPKGWECPRCHQIHAPSVLRCTCAEYVPHKPMENEKTRREYEEALKKWREKQEPYRPFYPQRPMELPRLPPVVIPWYHPDYPFRVIC